MNQKSEIIKSKIDEFLREMKDSYPTLIVNEDYDESDNSYMIWHNYKNHKEKDFVSKKVELVEKLFHNNGFYNIGFSYSSSINS